MKRVELRARGLSGMEKDTIHSFNLKAFLFKTHHFLGYFVNGCPTFLFAIVTAYEDWLLVFAA